MGTATVESPAATDLAPVRFEVDPAKRRHWKLKVEGPVARLEMDVQEDGGLRPGYELKLNSYDLGVDLELADAIQRLRFEHPEVRALLVTSAKDRIFCAGANIFMLGSSTHAFKVNFCKFTNETRLAIEDASARSGIKTICAINATASGGGYELAAACDEILLKDDGSSAVSFPEAPLLGVLPGTGGLTRLVDKRKVRRDLADAFSTLAEGVKGRRAKEWGLVDQAIPSSRFKAAVEERLKAAAAEQETRWSGRKGPGVVLPPLQPKRRGDGASYRHVELSVDAAQRTARVTMTVPSGDVPTTVTAARVAGADWWVLRAFRELDDVLLDLRFNRPEVGLVLLQTAGDPAKVLATDAVLSKSSEDWFVSEVLHFVRRTLKRLDVTAKSFFALAVPGSAFAGTLLELALAADRFYVRDDDDGKTQVALSPLQRDAYPMANGLSRLATRFLGDPTMVDKAFAHAGPLSAREALTAGIATFAPDDIDWDDEVRMAMEERVSLSPDALTGMEANLRFAGPETMETKIFGRLTAWQNWIFVRPNAVGERGALSLYGKPLRPEFDWEEDVAMSTVDLGAKIPNNVALASDKRLQRALEEWQPKFVEWWKGMGPEGFQAHDVYLRTAVGVDREGWANFGFVKMPDYRWGIFLADPEPDRKVGFGDHMGQPAWQQVPGEYRNMLRRIIVTQADTEPASVEQQRLLGQTAPSMYDLRNLFQVNVEEGRHLWAMVYLLQTYFARDGREEAEDLLRRRSGNPDNPRILGTFNEPVKDWLSFFMFTTFTDRDGKFQLLALAESGFDPLSRTCRFMLTEEAHHMFVGETGVSRVVQRTADVMNKVGADPAVVRAEHAIDLPTIQRYLNHWYSSSLDLFGGEKSSNAADFFASGLKGRYREEQYPDHLALEGAYSLPVLDGGAIRTESVPMRNAMNEVLRDNYVGDCEFVAGRWNRVLEKAGRPERLKLPNRRFRRAVGIYSDHPYDLDGNPISAEEFAKHESEWIPSESDFAFVRSLMHPVLEPGKMASWIAGPAKGIDDHPVEWEYVRPPR